MDGATLTAAASGFRSAIGFVTNSPTVSDEYVIASQKDFQNTTIVRATIARPHAHT